MVIVVDQLRGSSVIDPFTPVQRGCRESRHNSPTAGPQPPGLGAHHGSDFSVSIDVNVSKYSGVARFQLALGQHTTCNGFASEKRLAHCRRFACKIVAVTSAVECPASRASGAERPASRAPAEAS
jgi:hypothetical protein